MSNTQFCKCCPVCGGTPVLDPETLRMTCANHMVVDIPHSVDSLKADLESDDEQTRIKGQKRLAYFWNKAIRDGKYTVPVELRPKFLGRNTRIKEKLWLCGVGNKEAKIMFVSSNILEEEAKDTVDLGYGRTAQRTPRLLDSGYGVLLKRVAMMAGVDMEDCWYTSIVKYLPENKKHRLRPSRTLILEGMPYLEQEIERIQPSIIVAVGKLAFDSLVDFRATESEVYGGWFYSEKYHAKIYMIPHITQVAKPEKYERFALDFRRIHSMLTNSGEVESLPTNFTTVHNSTELEALVLKLELLDAKLLSVDCEWEGHQHVDGRLRSLQIAWNETDAAYIRFMDDKLNYAFDVSYEEAGSILGKWLNNPDVKYIGHHISADLMWMSHWLKLDWYKKAVFDSEFALQCCDESLDLGLDILALRYTDFGKYDWDLIYWRKQNPALRGDGYGHVPDNIMIPYACKDVLTVYRAMPHILANMERQKLTKYYNDILNPFVTDVFTFFGLKGLPIDRQKMDKMRVMYQWAKVELDKELRSSIAKEADTLLKAAVDKALQLAPDDFDAYLTLQLCKELIRSGRHKDAYQTLQEFVGPEHWAQVMHAWEHFIIAPAFNIRSKPQMQRWLFDVKQYTPVKSTANKAEGMPAVDWEKVQSYPPEKQKLFTPASDKSTLEILASRYDDSTILALLELNAVGNICKAFLREADTDDEGNVIAEKGLHYWLASDDAIHLMHSCTETGRPRSWNPNCLNWPSYIHKRLSQGLTHIISLRQKAGELPPFMKEYAEGAAFPTIRSVCMARPGWCIVEADYQTAEMRGLAFISGDKDLMRMILEPDDCFGIPKPECLPDGIDAEDCVVRLKFPPYVTLPEDKDKFLMTYAAGGSIKATFTEDQLQRNPDGSFKGPRFDMHWGACELSRNTCREVMDKKKDRGAAKVVNFCLADNSRILTDSGYKLITKVTTKDKLWDGKDWVAHGGVVERGYKLCVHRGSLACTPDHIIYVLTPENTVRPVCACDAYWHGRPLGVSVEMDLYNKPVLKPMRRRVEPISQQTLKRQQLLRKCAIIHLEVPFDKRTRHEHRLMAVYHKILDKERRRFGYTCTTTYDIVDAGPNNRFISDGILVHNSSSYGGTATSISRKIEADTGVKATPEEAQALLDAVERRQPRATQFFKEMEQVPELLGELRAASGRLRHCHTMAKGIEGMARTRQGQLTALGRECRNFPMQESVGSSASRACVAMLDFHWRNKDKYNLQGYPCVCLYDSIVVHCPVEERQIWTKALDLFMNLSDGWATAGGILRYPTDCEYNAGWSTKPGKEFKKQLHDKDWNPTPDHLKPLEEWLDAMIQLYTECPELSVYNKEDL